MLQIKVTVRFLQLRITLIYYHIFKILQEKEMILYREPSDTRCQIEREHDIRRNMSKAKVCIISRIFES